MEVPLVKDTIPQLTLTRYCRKQLLDKYKEALSTSPLKMATVLLYFFGTRISNRQSRFVCPRDRKTRGNPKGGATPLFGTRTLLAKSSVLYPLSAGLRKVGDWDSGRRFWSRQKELCFCARVSHRSKALWLAGRGYSWTMHHFWRVIQPLYLVQSFINFPNIDN